MRLTILGCRSGMPADGEASSGYLVETGTQTLLLDCGPGVATVLSGLLPATAPDAVIISHLHMDHCYDLLPLGKTMLSAALEIPVPGAVPVRDADLDPVPLLVPLGAADALARLAALFPVSTAPVLDRAFELAFSVREYAPGTRTQFGPTVGGPRSNWWGYATRRRTAGSG
jgi:glyoxylase-like metal-dependent hydrolase (beta-lactamase superfamily II)